MVKKRGYKVFDPDWTCHDQVCEIGKVYEIGKTYSIKVKPNVCNTGFHYCTKVVNCFRYYDFNPRNKVAEVEILGDIDRALDDDKECTNKIKIVRELTWHEVLDLVNMGEYNTGRYNTGDYNTGNRNVGDNNVGRYNTGSHNVGNYNVGGFNTGNWNTSSSNTGDYNTGRCNTGNYNTGSCNTGNYNIGDYNSCNYSTGFFNTLEQPIYFFNKEVKLTQDEIFNLEGLLVIDRRLQLSEWVYKYYMTDLEKQEHPEYKTTGGYLKTYTYKQAWANLWKRLSKDEKQAIKNLPNFDKKVFKKITGISTR